jgi:hypothetical protein
MEKEFENALDMLLRNLGKENKKESVMDEFKNKSNYSYYPWMKKETKTRYKFVGIGRALGLLVITDAFIVEMDLNRYETLHNYVKSHYPRRYDMFEFERNNECIVAFD